MLPKICQYSTSFPVQHKFTLLVVNFCWSFKFVQFLTGQHILKSGPLSQIAHSQIGTTSQIAYSQIAHFSNHYITRKTLYILKSAKFSNRTFWNRYILKSRHFLKSLKNKEIQAIAQIVPFSQIGTIFSNRSKQGVGKYYIESKPPTPVSRDRINKG